MLFAPNRSSLLTPNFVYGRRKENLDRIFCPPWGHRAYPCTPSFNVVTDDMIKLIGDRHNNID